MWGSLSIPAPDPHVIFLLMDFFENDIEQAFERSFERVFSTETLKGSQVTLVGLRESDASAAYDLVESSRNHLRMHLPWIDGTFPGDVCRRVRGWVLEEKLSQGGCWSVREGGELGAIAGFIMLEVRMSNHSAVISYWLGEKYTGRGLMTDALDTLSMFCFQSLRLNRLELFISVENEKSAALARRCGFKEEGVNRDFELKNGVFSDCWCFSKLARDV